MLEKPVVPIFPNCESYTTFATALKTGCRYPSQNIFQSKTLDLNYVLVCSASPLELKKMQATEVPPLQ